MKNLMAYGMAALLLAAGMDTAAAQAPPADHPGKPGSAAGKPPSAHPQPPPGNNRPPQHLPPNRRPQGRPVVVKRPVVVNHPIVVNHPVVVNRPVVVGRPGPGPGPGHFRLGGYQRPPGYFYRSWGAGVVLPSFFRAQTYWLNGYGDYGLPPPRYGAHWVRVDNDALLVVDATGEIIDVRHDIFY